jgi:hypothetical protein
MKKDFKDTKLSKFLGKVKDIGLDVAPIVTKASSGNVVGAISDTVQLLKGADKLEAPELLDELTIQKVTERWKSDANSDSFLSKNIRPLTLAWLIVSVTTICILDSANALTVEEMWVSLFSNLLMTVIVAYFGSRGVEKYKKIK